MVAIKIINGLIYNFYALEHNGHHELLDFLNEIKQHHESEFAKLVRSFDRTADHGLIQNPEKFKRLSDTISEFKTGGGVRILCFLEGRSIIVLTNGFKKKKKYDDEITRAENLRLAYLEAKATHNLTFIEETL